MQASTNQEEPDTASNLALELSAHTSIAYTSTKYRRKDLIYDSNISIMFRITYRLIELDYLKHREVYQNDAYTGIHEFFDRQRRSNPSHTLSFYILAAAKWVLRGGKLKDWRDMPDSYDTDRYRSIHKRKFKLPKGS